MAIPKFEDFLYPFLLHINDKAIKKNELKAALIKHFNYKWDMEEIRKWQKLLQ